MILKCHTHAVQYFYDEVRHGKLNMTKAITKKIAERTGAVLLGNYKSGSQEWLDLRKTGIGGSEVASILGLSKWTSAYTLWMQKTGKLPDSSSPNDSMKWGTLLEPIIIDEFERNHPELKVYRDVGTWHHAERRVQVTNPDGIYETEDGELGILEIKTAMYEDDWKFGVPNYYETQVQWYMSTFGIRQAKVAVLFHGNSYKEYDIVANDFMQEVAINEVMKFIELLETNTEPEFDGSKSTFETVRAMNPDIDPDLATVIDDELCNQYQVALRAYESANSELNLIKSKIMNEMGIAKTGIKSDGEVVFMRQSRNGSSPFLLYKGEK